MECNQILFNLVLCSSNDSLVRQKGPDFVNVVGSYRLPKDIAIHGGSTVTQKISRRGSQPFHPFAAFSSISHSASAFGLLVEGMVAFYRKFVACCCNNETLETGYFMERRDVVAGCPRLSTFVHPRRNLVHFLRGGKLTRAESG